MAFYTRFFSPFLSFLFVLSRSPFLALSPSLFFLRAHRRSRQSECVCVCGLTAADYIFAMFVAILGSHEPTLRAGGAGEADPHTAGL